MKKFTAFQQYCLYFTARRVISMPKRVELHVGVILTLVPFYTAGVGAPLKVDLGHLTQQFFFTPARNFYFAAIGHPYLATFAAHIFFICIRFTTELWCVKK